MSKANCFLLSLLLILMSSSLSATFFDNRYFPFIKKPYVSIEDAPSHFSWEMFATTGNDAFGPRTDEIGIPEIWGLFDQGRVADAMVEAGFPDPLQNVASLVDENVNDNKVPVRSVPWRVRGKIQGQGLAFSCHKTITDHLSAGCSFYLMRATSRNEYILTKENVLEDEALLLDEIRRDMFDSLGLQTNAADRSCVGDVDIYLRVGNAWDYTLKFRRIDAGLRVGGLFPAASPRNPNCPASVPFGGNGHYGIYVAGDVEFELKEDMKAGLWLQANKRFAKVRCERMPALDESRLFGALTGDVRINPGPTFVFSPYFQFEHLRQGLGARVQFTLTKHWRDSWEDRRCDKSVPAHFCNVEQFSSWGADTVSVHLFYDFGAIKYDRNFSPVAYLSWDIPVDWRVAHRSAKTYKVALGLQMSF